MHARRPEIREGAATFRHGWEARAAERLSLISFPICSLMAMRPINHLFTVQAWNSDGNRIEEETRSLRQPDRGRPMLWRLHAVLRQGPVHPAPRSAGAPGARAARRTDGAGGFLMGRRKNGKSKERR